MPAACPTSVQTTTIPSNPQHTPPRPPASLTFSYYNPLSAVASSSNGGAGTPAGGGPTGSPGGGAGGSAPPAILPPLRAVAMDSGTWPMDGGGVATCREQVRGMVVLFDACADLFCVCCLCHSSLIDLHLADTGLSCLSSSILHACKHYFHSPTHCTPHTTTTDPSKNQRSVKARMISCGTQRLRWHMTSNRSSPRCVRSRMCHRCVWLVGLLVWVGGGGVCSVI